MRNKPKLPLSIKFSATIMLMSLLTGVLITIGGYRVYYDQMLQRYAERGEELVRTAAEKVNWDKIDYYLETLEEDVEYQRTLEELRLLNRGGGSEYLYVLVPHEDGAYYVYDTDETDEQMELGYYWELYEDFVQYEDDLKGGKALGPLVSDEEYGRLLSFYIPFEDSNGEFAGYLGVDYSIDHILDEQWQFMRSLIVAAFFIAVAMTIVFYLLFRRMVLKPVDQIASAANSFIDDDNGQIMDENSITKLSVNTRDELQSLSESLKSMENKIQGYILNLEIATRKAETDPLTGLLNREAFERSVKIALEKGNNHKDSFFMMIDLDHFKEINDRYGHAVGDDVIKDSAKAIMKCFRSGDMVARKGGDEFAVYCEGVKNYAEVERRARAICEAIRKVEMKTGVKITASVGIAIASDNAWEYRRLYSEADEALYDAKDAGRDGYVIHQAGKEASSYLF